VKKGKKLKKRDETRKGNVKTWEKAVVYGWEGGVNQGKLF